MKGTAWFDNRISRTVVMMVGPALAVAGYLWARWGVDAADAFASGTGNTPFAAQAGPFTAMTAGVLMGVAAALATGRGAPWPLRRVGWVYAAALAAACAVTASLIAIG